ncbi:MAG: prepilin-type N-terminal cleavage/methylation domain-containing protein [Sideroxydans sp.]|jgi:prepilin-type N-terminal cleavage/methylation domain-containing protein
MNAALQPKRILGFSLVEMAIVLAIVGLLMATMLPNLTSQIEQQRRTEARKQLAEIQQSLMGFAVMNKRLPCPTTQADPTNADYGKEANDCWTSSPTTEGYLPWKTLGVSEIDPWGVKRNSSSDLWKGYWRYRVDRNFAKTSTLITLTTGFSSDSLLIKDNSGNALTGTEKPIAIIFSTGTDLVGNAENANTTEPNPKFEQTSGIYQSDVPNSNFDDILVWISRPQLFNRLVAAGKLP